MGRSRTRRRGGRARLPDLLVAGDDRKRWRRGPHEGVEEELGARSSSSRKGEAEEASRAAGSFAGIGTRRRCSRRGGRGSWGSGTGAAAPISSGSGAMASDADEGTRRGGCFFEHHEKTPERERNQRDMRSFRGGRRETGRERESGRRLI